MKKKISIHKVLMRLKSKPRKNSPASSAAAFIIHDKHVNSLN